MADTQFLTVLITLLSAVLLLGATAVLAWLVVDRIKEARSEHRKNLARQMMKFSLSPRQRTTRQKVV
jgi:hypothetical protein